MLYKIKSFTTFILNLSSVFSFLIELKKLHVILSSKYIFNFPYERNILIIILLRQMVVKLKLH